MGLFLTNTQLFTLQDVNWWSEVVWIIVMFLSAVWTLILTAPIHCRGSTGEQVMECYIFNQETNSSTSWMTWWWVHFQQLFIFWVVNYSFKITFPKTHCTLSWYAVLNGDSPAILHPEIFINNNKNSLKCVLCTTNYLGLCCMKEALQ